MPIRPEERGRYPKDWRAISARIRDRAGNVCEWCGVPNRAIVVRDLRVTSKRPEGASAWRLHEHDGVCCGEDCGAVKIVLTVAHLDHTPENCTDENLVALCQKCHLTYDAKRHASTARETRARRAGQGKLF
jgi:hypothetical protein